MPARKRSAKANGSVNAKGKRPREPASVVVKKKFEFRRKLLHSSIGLFSIYGIKNTVAIPKVVHGLTGALIIIVTADLIRFRSPRFERFYESVLGFLMRPSERTGWNGTIFFLLGAIFVLTFMPVDIGVFAIVLLSWCDTAASTFGRTFGRYTPSLPSSLFAERKSLAGFLAAVARYFFSSVPTPSWALSDIRTKLPAHSTARPFPLIPRLPDPHSTLSFDALTVICGLIGGLSEAIDVYGLDDNLVIPLVSSILLYVVMSLT